MKGFSTKMNTRGGGRAAGLDPEKWIKKSK